jgi:hypothetical protein
MGKEKKKRGRGRYGESNVFKGNLQVFAMNLYLCVFPFLASLACNS